MKQNRDDRIRRNLPSGIKNRVFTTVDRSSQKTLGRELTGQWASHTGFEPRQSVPQHQVLSHWEMSCLHIFPSGGLEFLGCKGETEIKGRGIYKGRQSKQNKVRLQASQLKRRVKDGRSCGSSRRPRKEPLSLWTLTLNSVGQREIKITAKDFKSLTSPSDPNMKQKWPTWGGERLSRGALESDRPRGKAVPRTLGAQTAWALHFATYKTRIKTSVSAWI